MNKNKFKLSYNCENCITKPCQIGCPLNNDIPAFINEIKKNNYRNAFNILSNTSVLMPICGRVCPQSKQCEGSCVKGVTYQNVEIGTLESLIGDMALEKKWKPNIPKKTKHNVAIIGGGPSGLTCAAFLRKNGIGVTIYEKYDYLGGLLTHGIPDFRLPKDVVKKTCDSILSYGIDVKYGMELGKNISLDELIKQYDAVYLAIGANRSNKMDIPGEELNGVYGGNELLEHNYQIDYKNKEVIISGGGNVAMDVARVVKRSSAKRVTVIYRRTEKEMPADLEEIEAAKKDGVEFIYSTNIKCILGNDKVNKIEVIRTKNESDGILEEIEDSKYIIPCDYVIMAIGSHADELIDSLPLDKNRQNKIQINMEGKTSNEKVFAGGDVAGTKSTIAWASCAGRNAANGIIKYLNEKTLN